MALPYPRLDNAAGVWNINDVYNNISGGTWPNFGALGLVGGGFTPGYNSIINSVNIATAGNASYFGDLTLARGEFGAASNFTRCLWAGGVNGVTPTNTSNIIDYVTFSTTGNAADFGDLLAATQRSTGAGGNATRSVWTEGSGDTDQIVFLNPTIFSNATDFGNLTVARTYVSAMSSPTRVVFAGGFSPLLVNTIDFIETATTGNSTDFGDLTAGTRAGGTFSSSTRGVYGGGQTPTFRSTIQYITIASQGNATNYGNLTAATDEPSGTSNSVRGIFFNGRTPVLLNEIQILNIPSGGNTTDFGDTTSQVYSAAANSNSHGGLNDGYQGTRPPVFFGQGNTGLFAGGSPGLSTINQINITTEGNSTNFGNLSIGRRQFSGGVSNEIFGIFSNGTPGANYPNVLDYVTFATGGNAANWGDSTISTSAGSEAGGSAANSTRGLFVLGVLNGVTVNNTINYIEFSSKGNRADFGDLTQSKYSTAGTASTTRAIFAGGNAPTTTNVIEYVTIATTGNGTDFGDLTAAKTVAGGGGNSTRGIIAGGGSPDNTTPINNIDFITIASAGNATDFGDLTVARRGMHTSSVANLTRSTFGGGITAPDGTVSVNTIDFIITATAGNATDFGDLINETNNMSGVSNGNGGLNGDTLTTQTDRALFAGGSVPGPQSNVIQYIEISTLGNTTDFGDLTVTADGIGGCGSQTRSLFGGGDAGPDRTNVINLVIPATTGNASDFGDLTQKRRGTTASSNSVRGLWFGGRDDPSDLNIIDLVTIASIGNAIDFGDLSSAKNSGSSVSNPTRALYAGGRIPAANTIDFVTIATTGNAADFGDLLAALETQTRASSSTRAIYAGGSPDQSANYINVIQYLTFASVGNATDFGDLTSARGQLGDGGTSNATRGVFGNGYLTPSTYTNTIDYITIASAGNAIDFGDISIANYYRMSGTSTAHGGLQ